MKRHWPARAIVFACASFLMAAAAAACGDDSPSSPPATDPSGDAGRDTDLPRLGDADLTADAKNDGSSSSSHRGEVVAESSAYRETSGESPRSSFRALFYRPSLDPSPSPTTTCNVRPAGACNVRVCTTPIPVRDAAPPDVIRVAPEAQMTEEARLAHAGAIKLVSTNHSPITITPSSDGYYMPHSDRTSLWKDGDATTLSIEAEGADVPAFRARVGTPTQASVMSPRPQRSDPSRSRVIAKRSDGIDFEWTNAAGSTNVNASISASWEEPAQGRQHGVYVTCTFDGSARKGRVPAEALTDIPRSADAPSFYFTEITVKTVLATPIVAGDWAIDVRAESVAVSANDRTLYEYSVTFE